MKFSSNGIGRKNGYRFEIKYGNWLDGVEQENKWYLYCSKPIPGDIYNKGTYTSRSYRFPTQEAAEVFCEKIASGEISLAEVKAAENKKLAELEEKRLQEHEKKIDVFMDKMRDLGVDPILVPEILKAHREMRNALGDNYPDLFEARISAIKDKSGLEKSKVSLPEISLKEYMELGQQDIDVCIVDIDTGEHYVPTICYLSKEEIASGNYEYDDWEKWALSLPLSHVSHTLGYPLAVVRTDYSCDEVSFLLDENDYETRKWENLDRRAYWAGADFDARLAFLKENKPFEIPFDATCMDAVDPNKRKDICNMLADITHVYVASYPHSENEFYVYYLKQDPFDDTLWFDFEDNEIPIKCTAPGKGLASTVDGKIYLAELMANNAKVEALEKAPTRRIEAAKGGPEL